MEKNKQKVALVDLDMTISDCRHRLHFVDGKDGKKKDFDAFNDAVHFDTPLSANISEVEKLMHLYEAIPIIVSSRSNVCREATHNFIEDNTNFDRICGYFMKKNNFTTKEVMDMAYMRVEGDMTPSVKLKEEWLKKICAEYAVVVALDDNADVCEMYRASIAGIDNFALVRNVGLHPREWRGI